MALINVETQPLYITLLTRAFVGGRDYQGLKKKGASSKSLQVRHSDFFPTPHGELDDNKHQVPQIHWLSKNHNIIISPDPPNASHKKGTTEIQYGGGESTLTLY